MTLAAKHGFTVMTTQDVAPEKILAGCRFQPRRGASQVYRSEDSDLHLVGTAEIPLGGYYAGQILDKQHLPIKVAAFSLCSRREDGAAGSTTRGLHSVQQFSKVEMFTLSHPDDFERCHEELRILEEEMYKSLDLHLKERYLPSQGLGIWVIGEYDIAAWMRGRGSCGEISSASNCN